MNPAAAPSTQHMEQLFTFRDPRAPYSDAESLANKCLDLSPEEVSLHQIRNRGSRHPAPHSLPCFSPGNQRDWCEASAGKPLPSFERCDTPTAPTWALLSSESSPAMLMFESVHGVRNKTAPHSLTIRLSGPLEPCQGPLTVLHHHILPTLLGSQEDRLGSQGQGRWFRVVHRWGESRSRIQLCNLGESTRFVGLGFLFC